MLVDRSSLHISTINTNDAKWTPYAAAVLPPCACSALPSCVVLPTLAPASPQIALATVLSLPRPSFASLHSFPQTLVINPQIQSIRTRASSVSEADSGAAGAPHGADAEAVAGLAAPAASSKTVPAYGPALMQPLPTSWCKDESTPAAFFKILTMQGRARHGCSRHPHCPICLSPVLPPFLLMDPFRLLPPRLQHHLHIFPGHW
jgi:hypothetical protein